MPDAYGNPTQYDWMNYLNTGQSYYNPAAADASKTVAQNNLWNAQAANYGTTAAQTAAQNAFNNALAASTLSGYFGAGVGNGTVAGQPTMPNIQWTTPQFGQYYPGGFNSVAPGTPTQAAVENQQQYGLNQAGVTGVYYDPGNMTYRPGTFIRNRDNGGIGQIQSNGRMIMFGDQGDFLRAGGTLAMLQNPDAIRDVSTAEYEDLNRNPGANFGGRPNGTASVQLQQMYGQYGLPQQGQQTLASIAMYGNNAAPYAGQKTMAQQQQDFSQAQAEANMTGMYYKPQTSRAELESQGRTLNGEIFNKDSSDPGMQAYLNTRTTWQQAATDWARDRNDALTAAGYNGQGSPGYQGQGTQTLAAQNQYWGQNFQQAQANQANTMDYLKLLSSLRGPADWAKYQQVLGSTPGGMRDLYAAAMGQYVPGAGATTGQNPQAASLQSMAGDVSGNPYYGQGYGQLGGGYANGYTTQPATQQTAPTGQMSGSNQVWGSGIGVGQQQASPEQQQQGMGNGTNTGGYNIPAPNQISAQAWNNMQPSQQQMLMGMYENQGWDKNDVANLYKQSLPRYGSTNQATAGTWRM